jgi:acetyltransferase-like isoleucine patch superfamily enzyme
MVFPFFLRRILLQALLGYELHPTSRIGFSYVSPKKLVLGPHARIGHLTVCKGMDLLQLDAHATIGRLNWITAFPSGKAIHFVHQPDRAPRLILGEHSAITHRHIIDCTHSIVIGAFTTVGGYHSQMLTHGIDLERSRQSSSPITIGRYCFLGTSCVVLGGSALPDYSVLGAKALLNKQYREQYFLYAGVPARPVKKISAESLYFSRREGFVK